MTTTLKARKIFRTHNTLLVYARTLHCKFGGVWKRIYSRCLDTHQITLMSITNGTMRLEAKAKSFGVPIEAGSALYGFGSGQDKFGLRCFIPNQSVSKG
jgi:hypothetical protein